MLNVLATILLVIIEACTTKLRKYIYNKKIGINLRIPSLNKSTLPGTANILRKAPI